MTSMLGTMYKGSYCVVVLQDQPIGPISANQNPFDPVAAVQTKLIHQSTIAETVWPIIMINTIKLET